MPLGLGGATVLGGGLNAAAGIGSSVINYFAQKHLAQEARAENYKYNELAASSAFNRQKELQRFLYNLQRKNYMDLESPEALMRQYKEAGLSPSVLAAGGVESGISGVATAGTAPQGNGAVGLQTPYSPIEPIDMSVIARNLAEAYKLRTDADTQQGNTELGEANIKDILASAGLKKAQTALTNANKCFQDIQNEITGETKNASIHKITFDAQKAYYEISEAFAQAANSNLEFQWNTETYNERIKNVARTGAKLLADAYAITTRGKLNEEEKAKVMVETEKIYNDLFYFHDIELQNAKAYQQWFETQAENLPQMLEARMQELGIEKTRMWLNFGTESAKALGAGLGMYFFGRKGNKAPIFNQKPFELNTPMPGGKAQTLQMYPM